jgi:dienelactone hydrolase
MSSPSGIGFAQQVETARANAQLAARIELHVIPTLTLSDEQFLNGEKTGARQVSVAGQLRIAQGAGRLPVVVMLHGSGGVDARADTWSSQFHEMGVSTFVIDGFTGRGLTNVAANQALLGRLNSIIDAYRALDMLAKHPRVDPSRIVLMGFSRGAQSALYASVSRFNRLWNASGIEFAAYVPFYPDCSTTYLTDLDIADRPIRIFQGTPDDQNPVAPCKMYVERLRGAGRDVQLSEYPNAQHGFDSPLLAPIFRPDGQTLRHCVIQEQSAGRLVNAVTKQSFTYDDPCVERGSHGGYDPVATRAAHVAVGEFVKAIFKLP